MVVAVTWLNIRKMQYLFNYSYLLSLDIRD